jgi:hypothetical protein
MSKSSPASSGGESAPGPSPAGIGIPIAKHVEATTSMIARKYILGVCVCACECMGDAEEIDDRRQVRERREGRHDEARAPHDMRKCAE